MASVTYEQVVRGVEQLTPADQQRLLETLIEQSASAPDAIRSMRTKLAHRPPLTDQERTAAQAWLVRVDAFAARVGDAWDDPTISAVDAVREQRRDL